MAAKLETSQHKGSDVVYDLCCSICEDDGLCQEGRFHCRKCSKYFCDSCVLTHNKFHKDHSVTTKGEGDNWPVTKTVDDTLELCEEHSTEKLTMFCEDHEKLLCQLCLLHNHRQCSRVVLLADKIKSTAQCMDIANMAKSIEKLQKSLEDVVKIGEQNMKTSYKCVQQEILNFRREINEKLDRLQQNTVRKVEELHSSLKISLENESKQCAEFISKIKGYDINSSKNVSAERSFIMYRKCLDKTASADSLLGKIIKNTIFKFQYNTDLKQFIDSCTELGNIPIHEAAAPSVGPNTVLKFQEKSQYKVRSATDKFTCNIRGVSESVNGEIIIFDRNNYCVKLLDQAHNFIEQMKLDSTLCCMCNISTNEVALCSSDDSCEKTTEFHFLRVDKGRIVKLNSFKLYLSKKCNGIASHQGDLFLTSGNAVFQYTLDGQKRKKLNVAGVAVLMGVGVSPDGKRIYVTSVNGYLRTLNRDGAVTAWLQDHAFKTDNAIPNIHVAAKGQVFVFGEKTVSQVDADGKKVLNTITLDISNPGSVYVNEDTSKMIVGFYYNENVIELKTKNS